MANKKRNNKVDILKLNYPQSSKGEFIFNEAEDSYFRDMEAILVGLRLLAKFPYHYDGIYRISVTSIWMVYTIVMQCFQAWFGLSFFSKILQQLFSAARYDDILHALYYLGLNLFLYTTPILYFTLGPQLVSYLNQWRVLQLNYERCMGEAMSSELRILVFWATIFFAIVPSIFLLLGEVIFSGWTAIFNMIPFLGTFSFVWLKMLLWIFTCIKIRRLVSNIKEHIIMELSYHSEKHREYNLTKFCELWDGLSELCQGLGSTFTLFTAGFLLVMITISVTSFYSLVFDVIQAQVTLLHFKFTLGALACIAYVWIMCEIAHTTMEKVGEEVLREIMMINTTNLSEMEFKELSNLINTISINTPKIQIGEVAILNRHFVISVLQRMLSYLIVALQFSVNKRPG